MDYQLEKKHHVSCCASYRHLGEKAMGKLGWPERENASTIGMRQTSCDGSAIEIPSGSGDTR